MVDKYPFGFNINMGSLRDWNSLVESCKMLNSSHQMAMISASSNPRNDIDSVMRLHAAIGDPNLQWLIRVYSPLEGDWHKVNIDAYVAYCAEIHKHFPNVIFDAPSNEPGVPDDKVEAFIDNQVALIEKFAAKGIRYAACCYGMGSPHHEHVTSGRYDKLLRALAKYDTAYLSEHHYSMGWLEAGSGYSYDILLDPANLSKYWRTKWEVQPGHYLIRRSDYWAMRADVLGIRRPRVFLTECPFDQNPDAVTQLNNRHNGIWDRIRNQYGLQKYNYDLRGFNTYEKYWKATYPNLTYDEVLAKLLIHFIDDCLHVDYMVAAFGFTWNTDWDIPMGTDLSIPERRATIQLLSNHAKTYVKSASPTPLPDPVPTPTPEPEPPLPLPTYRRFYVEGFNSVRQIPVNAVIRATPGGSQIGFLPMRPTVSVADVSTATVNSGDYDWFEIVLHPDTDHAIHGWIASHVLWTVKEVESVDIDILIAAIQLRIDGIQSELDKLVDLLDDVA